MTGWWFGTFFIFPYIGNNHLNWLSYFSEGWPNHQPVLFLFYVHAYVYTLLVWTHVFKPATNAPRYKTALARCLRPAASVGNWLGPMTLWMGPSGYKRNYVIWLQKAHGNMLGDENTLFREEARLCHKMFSFRHWCCFATYVILCSVQSQH